jgi:hypothetical protein
VVLVVMGISPLLTGGIEGNTFISSVTACLQPHLNEKLFSRLAKRNFYHLTNEVCMRML